VAWCAQPDAPWELYVRLLHAQWALLVHPHVPDEAAATCVVAIARPDRQTMLAQLGDGLACVTRSDGRTEELEFSRDGFANQTTGLGIARSAQEWRILELPPLRGGDALLMATDGVADDLVPDRRAELVHHLRESCTIEGNLSSARLRRELVDWPVPHHTDDRTMILCSLKGDAA
jgi:serine/threonine protein phosphatase PrpC